MGVPFEWVRLYGTVLALCVLPPSDEGGGFLRSKKTEGENDYPSVSLTLDSSPDKGSREDKSAGVDGVAARLW